MRDIDKSLIDVATFHPNSIEPPNAWVGHLPFAAWVIKYCMPNVFVELGTHSGNSYFSFCQTVKETGLDTKCYAVDTWQGEEHAGYYNEEVFQQVNTYNNDNYASFSRLLRMKFDEAVDCFSDRSIDLLHIDGLHTYEAVKHDFETWLPKLSPSAIVLFHDTNVRERGFGVWKFWEELQNIYPNNIEFLHSHGLGVLQLNGMNSRESLQWLQSTPQQQKIIKDYFSALGARQLERFDLETINISVAQRDEQLGALNQVVAQRDEQLGVLNQAIDHRDQTITAILDSTSWRITQPLRKVKECITALTSLKLFKIFYLFKVVYSNPKLIKKAWFYVKRGNFSYLISRTSEKLNSLQEKTSSADSLFQFDIEKLFLIFDAAKYSLNEQVIDIVIPVYNGYEFLEKLFASIHHNTQEDNYRLIVIDDFSTDERVVAFLRQTLQRFSNSILIENETNLGFVQSVNRAVREAKNHFVILNTDVEVPSLWLERLMYPIIHQPKVASTTPFTNAGTIASFPVFLEDNIIFENLNIDILDSYFRDINPQEFDNEIPTGVGFCMGINYDLVKKIGFFDEKTFAKGYGEENDWCQRAIKENYKNIFVPNLFVYHKHGGSFSHDEKNKYIEQNSIKLNLKHPSYVANVNTYIQKNPYSSLRKLLSIIISGNQEGVYLIIDHDLGGGAIHYSQELIDRYSVEGKRVLKVSFNMYNNCYEINYPKYNIEVSLKDFESLKYVLGRLWIKEIFLNELVSHKYIYKLLAFVRKQKKRKSKLVVPIHDFFVICPSYTLLNNYGKYCNLPPLDECKNCLMSSDMEWKAFMYEKLDIFEWRKVWGETLNLADEILCFSNSSKEILLRAYPLLNEDKVLVEPHTIKEIGKVNLSANKKQTIIIGVLGRINYAKGSKIIKELVKAVESQKLDIKIVIIGELSEPITSSVLSVTGRYKKEDLMSIVKDINIDLFFIPSIWPETFSYTTQEIISMEFPLMVFDLGAPAERVKKYKKGYIVDAMNSDSILKTIDEFRIKFIR